MTSPIIVHSNSTHTMTKKLFSSEIDPLLQKTLLCTKNAVVASNKATLHLYKKLGFIQLGIIPKGFHIFSFTLL